MITQQALAADAASRHAYITVRWEYPNNLINRIEKNNYIKTIKN